MKFDSESNGSRSDNGPGLVAEAVEEWAKSESVQMHLIKLGSPWEDGCVESFHGELRDECLRREEFGNSLEAQVVIENWRQQYDNERPHSSPGYKTPRE